jgi:hypothetical protein
LQSIAIARSVMNFGYGRKRMPTLLLDWLSSFPDNMEKQVQNVAIADAILHHELRIFVWDVAHNLKDRILAATGGTSLWSSIISAASRPMIEVSLVTRQKPRNIAEYWRRFSDHRLLFEGIRLPRTLIFAIDCKSTGQRSGWSAPPIRELL